MMTLILAAAPETEYAYVKQLAKQADTILCADGGLKHAMVCGITPDLVVGDFDSGKKPEQDIACITLKPEKDDSDLMSCTKAALQQGADTICYACASGGRIDHFLSNLSLLEFLQEKNCQGIFYDSMNRVTFHSGGTKQYQADKAYKYLGIIPLDKKLTGVTLRGLKYQLTDAVLYRSQMISISNEPTEELYSITIGEGNALIVESKG